MVNNPAPPWAPQQPNFGGKAGAAMNAPPPPLAGQPEPAMAAPVLAWPPAENV